MQKSAEVNAIVDFFESKRRAHTKYSIRQNHGLSWFCIDKEYINDGIITGDQASISRQVEVAIIAVTPDCPRIC